jgi:hypothetical protein
VREDESTVRVGLELGETAQHVSDPDLVAVLAVVPLDARRGVLSGGGCRTCSGLRGHVVPFVPLFNVRAGVAFRQRASPAVGLADSGGVDIVA